MSEVISGFYSTPVTKHEAGGFIPDSLPGRTADALSTESGESEPVVKFYRHTAADVPPPNGSDEDRRGAAQGVEGSEATIDGDAGPDERVDQSPVDWPDDLDPEHPVAREFAAIGLDTATQKRVLDLMPKYEAARDAHLVEEMRAERDGWVSQSRSLPKGTLEDAREAYSNLRGIPGLVDLIEETGLGDHPAVIRLFAEVNRMVRSPRR